MLSPPKSNETGVSPERAPHNHPHVGSPQRYRAQPGGPHIRRVHFPHRRHAVPRYYIGAVPAAAGARPAATEPNATEDACRHGSRPPAATRVADRCAVSFRLRSRHRGGAESADDRAPNGSTAISNASATTWCSPRRLRASPPRPKRRRSWAISLPAYIERLNARPGMQRTMRE
jgi:hypothetical protein